MISTEDAQTVIGKGGSVLVADGDRIGKLGSVFLDDTTGHPAWASVSSGLLGHSESFVPLTGGRVYGDDIWVPCTTEQVHGPPHVTAHDGKLSKDDHAALHRYYEGDGQPAEPDPPRVDRSAADDAQHVDDADDADAATGVHTDDDLTVTRSEDQLRIHTERVPVTRVRLRKVVVTESVTQTIPVSHEEFRLEEVPIGEADGEDEVASPPSGEEYEVVLREERIVVTKEVAAVERVRVRVETVAGERRVSADVQKERVVADETRASNLS